MVGSSGSGIYSGRQGALSSVAVGTRKSTLLVAELSKIPGNSVEVPREIVSSETPSIFLKRDQLDATNYNLFQLESNGNKYQSTSCNDFFCCNWNFKLDKIGSLAVNEVRLLLLKSFRG